MYISQWQSSRLHVTNLQALHRFTDKMLPVFLIIILLVSSSCEAARILALLLLPMRSHWIVMEPLLQELATRGHQVTVYSSFPQKKPLANYTDVDFSAHLPPFTSQFSVDYIKDSIGGSWKITFFVNQIHEESCKVLKLPALQNLMKSEGKYDLLVTEVFGSDCFAYFAHKLNIPFVSFTTSMGVPWGADRVGLPDNPSYVPTNFLTKYSEVMDIWERCYNTIVYVYGKFLHFNIFSMRTQQLAEKQFKQYLPPVNEVVGKTSVLFVNSYHTLIQSRPFPPNLIEVGGIHIKERQPLPKDLQDILDRAQNGVIVMSFGSLVRSSSIPHSIIMAFMNVFSKISQTVIFKYEEDLPNRPPNVFIRKWLPQRDMLEHENVVAQIIHGGLASTIEAVHFNKPIIGIPFFVDQHVNIKAVVRRGAGLQLNLEDVSEETVTAAVEEILYNPKYKKNMRRLSLQFRDRPMTPLQTAVYWTEYVIRHQGAPHLRPASVGMPFYQYLLLDVIAVLFVSLFSVIFAFYFTVRWVLSLSKKDSLLPKNVNYEKKNS